MTVISYSHKFVFIHIPKNGGTSLTSALLPYLRFRDMSRFSDNNFLSFPAKLITRIETSNLIAQLLPEKERGASSWYTGIHNHESYLELSSKSIFKTIKDFLYFTIIRNPIDRHLSLYSYLKMSSWHPLNSIALGDLHEFTSDLIDTYPKTQASFISSEDNKQLVKLYSFDGVFANSFFSLPERNLSVSLKHLNSSKRSYVSRSQLDIQLKDSLSPSTWSTFVDYYHDDFLLYTKSLTTF